LLAYQPGYVKNVENQLFTGKYRKLNLFSINKLFPHLATFLPTNRIFSTEFQPMVHDAMPEPSSVYEQ
jgi:hypothetical protein